MDVMVSVIVPVYNSEKYLGECLDSILKQTLQDYEIICVDDGSIDNSVNILEEYASKDRRIRVIRQKNSFAGVARNNGLSVACGKYVCFWDSDDFVDPSTLEKLYAKAEETNADIVICSLNYYYAETNTYSSRNYFRKEKVNGLEVFSIKDIPDSICNIANPGPTNKLFKRSFIEYHGLKFQDLRNSNDVYFVVMAFCLADKITYIDEALYNYRIDTTESLQKTKSRTPLNFIYAYEAVYDELQRLKLFDLVKKSYVELVLGAIVFNIGTTDNNSVIFNYLNEKFYPKTKILELRPEDYSYMAEYKLDILRYGKANISTFSREEVEDIYSFKHKLASINENKEFCIINNRANAVAPLVSVIIPVYNSEKYLRECLDSVLNQSLNDFEVICINDGSRDASLDILKEYAEKDRRIIICTQKNSGAGATRNQGIAAARGKYLYFCDSDDYILSDTLEQLVKKAENNNLDVVYFSIDAFSDNEESCVEKFARIKNYYARKNDYPLVYSGPELFANMFLQHEFLEAPVLQLINRNFLLAKGVRFLENVIYEDTDFSFELILSAQRVGFLPQKYYRRRVRTDSVMGSKLKFYNCYCIVKVVEKMTEFVKSQNMPYQQETIAYQYISNVLKQGRNRYMEMLKKERKTIFALSGFERFWFNVYISDFCNSEENIIKYKDSLAKKEMLLEKKEETIAKKDEQIARCKERLDIKDQQLAERKQLLGERRELLQVRAAKIAAQEQQIAELRRLLSEEEQRLRIAEQQLLEQQQNLQKLEQQINNQNSLLEHKEQELQAANAKITEMSSGFFSRLSKKINGK